MSQEQIYIQGFFDGLRPAPRLTVSQWAERNRVLSSVSSSSPGRWRNSRTPYLVEIMDAMSVYSEVEKIVVTKGSQVGLTEAAFNAMGYYIDHSPSPMLYVMPTEAAVKKNSKIRFDPMVEASPSLAAKISPMRSRDKENSVLQKSFPGGVLIFAGANSPTNLRSIAVRICVLDELDAMPRDVGGEGSPIDLAAARTRTFAGRKIVLISTPTIKGSSMIEDEYELTDKRMLFLPCPECGEMQALQFDQLRWTPGEPATVRYECCGCGAAIPERYKPQMLKHAEWRATAPENANPKVRGYHLSSLYSPLGWLSWAQIVAGYEKSRGKQEQEKTFVNTVLGETYATDGDKPKWENLFARRENYPNYCPPAAVEIITAGVDVQKDRLELEIVGWSRDQQRWGIDYRVLPGETADTGPGSVWDSLRAVLQETFTREDGLVMPIARMAVDSGYNTSEVYEFVNSVGPSRAIAVKGYDNLTMAIGKPRAFKFAPSGQAVKMSNIWPVGSSFLKRELYGRLALRRGEDGVCPPGYCHFPTSYDEYYFKMLTAEEEQRRIVKGYPVLEWVKTFVRNEALDCAIYARAAFSAIGCDLWRDEHWAVYGKTLLQLVDVQPVTQRKREKKKSGSFWE